MNMPDTAQILIVDDLYQNLKLLSEILSGRGYRVRPAGSGPLALRTLEAEAPDLIILDVRMPDMDGYEVCRRIKQDERFSRIPVIFISAMDDIDDKVKGFSAGGVDYLTKPFQAAEVLLRVETHLGLWHLRQELETQNVHLTALNAALEKANHNLACAQNRIFQQEKMASLGQLAAGVAHEINNPLGFIMCNIGALKAYTEKYRKLQELAQAVPFTEIKRFLPDSYESYIEAIEKHLQKTDFEVIGNDVTETFRDMTEGLERVSTIVKGLRQFSRIDAPDGYVAFNLNEEIENIMTLTLDELKRTAEIRCELGEISVLHGNAEKINQVILNLILNAGASIRAKNPPEPGLIEIRTWQEAGDVKFTVRDNGIGIENTHIREIFNPFFTTKPVGDGTGLGLSMSYDIIVNQFGGWIEVQSELGQWTEFTITLPMATDNVPGGNNSTKTGKFKNKR